MYLEILTILLSLLYFYMGFYAYFVQKDAPANRIFLILTALFSGWSLSGAFFNAMNRPEFSSVWMCASYAIWTIGTALILHFCISLRKMKGRLEAKALGIIYLPAFIMFLGMIVFNGLSPSNQIIATPLNLLFGIPGGIVFYFIYIGISVSELNEMGKNSDDSRVRLQSRLISRALVIASVLIAIYGFILPPLVPEPLPVLLPFFPAIWIVSMWISITKYGFLTVTMEIATKEILDNIQEIIILMDHNSVIIDVNKTFEETVRVKKETINGKMLRDVLSKNPEMMGYVENVMKKDVPFYSGDVDFYLNSDTSIPMRINISPITDRLNRVVGIVVAANDLTLEKKYERLSITDSLTNAYNRMKLERLMERLILDHERFSVILFDMDHFKKINDKFGHSAGDHVLKSTVDLINNELRASDYIGRWGGEEFILILPGTPEHIAQQVSERIRTAVSNYNFGIDSTVTISLGVAESDGADISVVELVNRADLALYEAKHAGRNRTILYSEISE